MTTELRGGLRVNTCIVSNEFAGVHGDGPVAAACTGLALRLKKEGHQVTLLCGCRSSVEPFGCWQARYALDGIDLLPLEPPDDIATDAPSFAADSYYVYRWLKGRNFHAIHFPDAGGLGYYSVVAKHEGLAFESTALCVGLVAPIRRTIQRTSGFMIEPMQPLMDFMERRSAELADVVACPDPETLAWAREHRWLLPQQVVEVQGEDPALAWLRAQERAMARQEPRAAVRDPLVSVCIAHYNRPELLAQAMASIEAQDYGRFEVVIVNDGSTNPASRAFLDRLEASWTHRPLRVLHQENRYLGAARNAAVKAARGEYVLIMDDDNLMMPAQIATYSRAASCSGADILTSVMQNFRGKDAPAPGTKPLSRFLPVGGAAVTGLFWNIYGDANALIRKTAYEAIGGFTEDRGLSYEDWELFGRAVLAGYRLEVVPETLQWYRVSEDSVVRTTSELKNHCRISRPYLAALPEPLADLASVAKGMHRRLATDRQAQQGGLIAQILAQVPALLESGSHGKACTLMQAGRIMAELAGDAVTAERIERSLRQMDPKAVPGQ